MLLGSSPRHKRRRSFRLDRRPQNPQFLEDAYPLVEWPASRQTGEMNIAVRIIMILPMAIFSHAFIADSLGQAPGAQTCFSLDGQNICITQDTYREDVCTAVEAFAVHWQLPEGYFARLIWQESRFDSAALSPAGAEGIAQFMPSTGRLRGLVDPFDPAEALAHSAEYLRFLQLKFGNLGLAAAAYNGGEGRISRYVANGGGALPAETRSYVMIVTGNSVDAWLSGDVDPVDYTLDPAIDFHAACVNMAESVRIPNLMADPGEWQPWGLLVAQSASADQAQSRFASVQAKFGQVLAGEKLMLISVRNPNFGNRTRFSAMIGRQSRGEAQELCERLIAAGGDCIVQKNSP
ncbi:MAG: lytic transglycosylase domain-containing protein [Alphaproteobacteria bacterium]|nr:MAG: lytic transglycosylase domain-containing protein [Alphaproteobacteria bacterium]